MQNAITYVTIDNKTSGKKVYAGESKIMNLTLIKTSLKLEK
ncbi:hypothetical protein SynA1524_01113 [Synechococcus sp. A15-24]|nr:hypothetical protein SynA1524_01113 [Synechococcus sp. A15-24]